MKDIAHESTCNSTIASYAAYHRSHVARGIYMYGFCIVVACEERSSRYEGGEISKYTRVCLTHGPAGFDNHSRVFITSPERR